MASSSTSSLPGCPPHLRRRTMSGHLYCALPDQEIHTIVLFGASGDLSRRKLMPAFYTLYRDGLIGKNTRILGYARSEMTTEEFIERCSASMPGETRGDKANTYQEFTELVHYTSGSYDEADSYVALDEFIRTKIETLGDQKRKNRLFYLSLPPYVFKIASELIGLHLRSESGWNRIIVEKPLGHDTESSADLSSALQSSFAESEIFRIDHYLGKEVSQNLLVMRFANFLFEPLWNRSMIANVQVILKESIGVEGRGSYFDSYGIIRDVIQNHLMQVLSLITIEPPVSLDANDVRDEKVKLFKSIEPINIDDVVIGQYKRRKIGSVEHLGYRDDPTVPDNSITPTFCAFVLKINNRRWDGVPIFIKAGKGLDEKLFEIRVLFHKTPGNLFATNPVARHFQNELVIRVQPNEGMYLRVLNKAPGIVASLVESDLDLSYHERFEGPIPDAYHRLLYEALNGDQRNFVREDELDLCWKLFTPVLQKLEDERVEPHFYSFGSRGPVEAEYLVAKYGGKWNDE